VKAKLLEVPGPPRAPLVGNVPQVYKRKVFDTFNQLAKQYDGIYQMIFPGAQLYIVYKHAYVQELLDENRFGKAVTGSLAEISRLSGNGLFTAENDDPVWLTAHRILMPSFSMKNMRDYVAIMNVVARELVDKWSQRIGQDLDISADMTRYTLETIGRCGFNFSFNSFQSEDLHPFIDAMNRSLDYALRRTHLLPIQKKLAFQSNRIFAQDCALMNETVDLIIKDREREIAKGTAPERPDLLDRMLRGSDPTSGEKLDAINIRYQLITFLIAGHETTSGLLSFTLYFLAKHPDVFEKAREEIDSLMSGTDDSSVGIGEISRMRYLTQILKEALRLYPTAPGFLVRSSKEEALGGTYRLNANQTCFVLLHELHRDPEVWGPDAEEFRPERFAPDRMSHIPSTAFRPFGNGARSCIGQNFAVLEATVVLAFIIQNFDIVDRHNYTLSIGETLTIKPENFYLQVRARERPGQRRSVS